MPPRARGTKSNPFPVKQVEGVAETPPVETINEYAINAGQNLPNHTSSLNGLGKYVRQGVPELPTFRTKQQAYRYAAWLITMAEIQLPDEEDCESHDFEAVLNAVQNA